MRKPSALDKERPDPMIPLHKPARQPLKNFSFFGLLSSNRETAHKPNRIADGIGWNGSGDSVGWEARLVGGDLSFYCGAFFFRNILNMMKLYM